MFIAATVIFCGCCYCCDCLVVILVTMIVMISIIGFVLIFDAAAVKSSCSNGVVAVLISVISILMIACCY